MRFTFAEASMAPRKPNIVLAWIGRLVNLVVIGVIGWALIETAAFIKIYAGAIGH